MNGVLAVSAAPRKAHKGPPQIVRSAQPIEFPGDRGSRSLHRHGREFVRPVGGAMSDCQLNVALVGQKVGYDGKPLMQRDAKGVLKQHGFMACWYASACMVAYYREAGPRLGLPEKW